MLAKEGGIQLSSMAGQGFPSHSHVPSPSLSCPEPAGPSSLLPLLQTPSFRTALLAPGPACPPHPPCLVRPSGTGSACSVFQDSLLLFSEEPGWLSLAQPSTSGLTNMSGTGSLTQTGHRARGGSPQESCGQEDRTSMTDMAAPPF